MFESQARNWKWMVPAMLVPVLLVAWQKTPEDLRIIPAGLVLVMFIAALLNGWAFIAHHWSRTFADMRVAMNSTPEVRMFEAARGMHPDAVKSLLEHRRTIWRIKYIPKIDTVDWVLDEAPGVHGGFLDYVLDNSNGSLMPKRGYLSEGSKQFDPEGIVTDYQQYDDLLMLLQQKLMVTQALGNQAPKFIPPWNRELLRHRFGLDGTGYEVDDEMSDALKAVVREQRKAAGGIPASNKSVKVNGDVPDVIENALNDLEQTAEMRARIQ